MPIDSTIYFLMARINGPKIVLYIKCIYGSMIFLTLLSSYKLLYIVKLLIFIIVLPKIIF